MSEASNPVASSSSEGLKPTIALRTSNVPALVMKAHKKIDKAPIAWVPKAPAPQSGVAMIPQIPTVP